MAVQTFNDAIQDQSNRLIDLAIEDEKQKMAAGLMDLGEYKRSAGMVQGLLKAKALIEQAKTQLMRR
jgi:hypothetical protein